MAITIDVSNLTVDTEASTVTLVDDSVFTSPSRSGMGVFVKFYKVDHSSNRVAIETTGNDSDPNTDSEFTATYDTDGWYQIFYVAVPDFAIASYVIYDAVFRPSTGDVYRAKGSVSITTETDLDNSNDWEVITDPTALCLNVGESNESANLTTLTSITIGDTVLYALTKENFGTKTGEAFIEATSDYKRSQDVRLYELLGLAVDGMNIANNRQEYALGEIIARRAIALCSAC